MSWAYIIVVDTSACLAIIWASRSPAPPSSASVTAVWRSECAVCHLSSIPTRRIESFATRDTVLVLMRPPQSARLEANRGSPGRAHDLVTRYSDMGPIAAGVSTTKESLPGRPLPCT